MPLKGKSYKDNGDKNGEEKITREIIKKISQS